MSLILDALNRSRQDLGDVPGLDSQHQSEESRPATSHRWWILALLIALAVIGYLLYERGGEQVAPAGQLPEPAVMREPAIVPGQKAERPQTPEAEPQVRVAPAPPEPAAPVVQPIPDAEVAALYAKKPTPARVPTAPEPGPVTRNEKVAKPASVAPVAKENVSEQPVDLETMLNQAQDELENTRLEEHPAPFLASLSQQSKDSIPTIFYERHDYSGKPGQSAVVLNGKTLKRGGRTSAGVIVDEILPDSVVLTYKGTQFRLRALNSWVNL